MELGNAIFGHSRGQYPIDRESWSNVFFNNFIYEINADAYGMVNGVIGYENDTFKLMPYDWDSECTCGLEDMIDEWWEGKVHKDNCYQKELIREKIKHGWIIDISSNIEHTPQNMNFEKYSKIEDKIYKKLCKKYNLPRAGCAVHCTCGLDESFEEWVKDKKHKNNCRLIQPNFLYKPTGFQIMCYKYFLRDSYMNQNINLDEFREILKNCVESYKNE